MRTARVLVLVLVLVISAAAGLVACSVTVESGELTGVRHHHEEHEGSPSSTPTASASEDRG